MLKNTSNKFVDTFVLSNVMVQPIGGDFDGDTVSVKPIYGAEACKELEDFIASKRHFLSLGGDLIRKLNMEGVQAAYNLTMCPDRDYVFIDPQF